MQIPKIKISWYFTVVAAMVWSTAAMLTEKKNVFHLDRKTVFHLDIYIVCLYTLATINTMILFAEVQSNRLGTNVLYHRLWDCLFLWTKELLWIWRSQFNRKWNHLENNYWLQVSQARMSHIISHTRIINFTCILEVHALTSLGYCISRLNISVS